MDLKPTLQQLGLNEKEASVYLACLELGNATVLQISRKASIKRPTCYLILDELLKRGLVNNVPRGTKTYFSAENPYTIQKNLENRLRSVQDAMPMLQALYSTQKNKPVVKVYEGRDALVKVYEDEVLAGKEVLFFGSIHHIYQDFSDTLEKFVKLTLSKQIRSREIITHNDMDYQYAEKVDNKRNQVRFLPKDLKSQFLIDCAIIRNKLFIFSVSDDHFVTVIESKDIYESFLTLFELAWRSATPAKEVLDVDVPRGTSNRSEKQTLF